MTPLTENLRDVVHGTVSLNGRIVLVLVSKISLPSVSAKTEKLLLFSSLDRIDKFWG